MAVPDAFSFVTNPSPAPPAALWNAPAVTGRLVDVVRAAT
jgi:hypothetical protein